MTVDRGRRSSTARLRRNGARSSRSGTTRRSAVAERAAITLPQWSPLRRSGMTRSRTGSTPAPATCRNGARSGGAG